MKKLAVSIVALMFIPFLNAFGQIPLEENIEFNKKMVPAVCIEVPDIDASTANASFQSFLENQGLKGKKMKKFQAYLNQTFTRISPDNLDMYTTVLVKGKKKNAKTYVYFLLSKGNENFVDATVNPAEIDNVKVLMTEYIAYSSKYTLNMKINAKKEEIAALEKDLKKINKAASKENKKKEKIEKKIKKIESDASKKEGELNKVKEELNTLQSQVN